MISGKQFHHLGRKQKQESIQEHVADRQPHSHNTYTHPHTRTHTQMDKITTSKHSTKHKYKLICLTIKLHTVHHTTEDAVTQSADGAHPGGEE